jgi:hypothetical protein
MCGIQDWYGRPRLRTVRRALVCRWVGSRLLRAVHFRIEPAASPATLLRRLGAPPSWSLDETPAEVLAPLYPAASALARDLALRPAGEGAPVSTPIRLKPRPGQP